MPTSFELILDDTSPVVNYYPFAETLGVPDLTAGWNSFFSQSGFLSELGQTGNGTSMHVTSLDGATLTIGWFGTGVSLFGSAIGAAYSVSIDGATPSLGLPSGDLLAKFQDLENGQHLIALVAHPASTADFPSYITFDRAALNVSTNYTGATVSSEFIDSTSDRWFFSGDWMPLTNSTLTPAPRITKTQGNTATISFRGTAVAVMGLRNATNGHYNITLDGAVTTFDGHSDWFEPSTLFLQGGLDENTRHSLTVTNVDNASLAITGLNITHVSGGSPLSSSPGAPSPGASRGFSSGSIIALVLVVVIAVLTIATLFICLYMRHRQPRNRKPTYTAGPDPRSSYLHEFTGVESPRRRHQSKRQSRRGEPAMYEFSSATQTLSAQTTEQARTVSSAGDSSAVLLAPSRSNTIDPTSPMPYLRLPDSSGRGKGQPKPYGNQQDEIAHETEGAGQLQRDRTRGPERESLNTIMQDLLERYSVPDKEIVGEVTQPPPSSKKRLKSRRRSQSVDSGSTRPLRLHIPGPPLPTPIARSVTAKVRRSSFLLSPLVDGSRRTSRRSSFGVSHKFVALPDTPTSPGTIRPGMREGGNAIQHTSTREESQRNSGVNEWLERLKAHNKQGNAPVVPPLPSNWVPPW